MKKICAALIILFLAGCAAPSGTIKHLQGVEITEYEGERLSSIGDFRENSIEGVQQVNIDDYRLRIGGLAENPKEYTYEEVLAHQKYTKVVTLYCVEGWDATILWEGILLKDLFGEAVPKEGASVAIFHAVDGYTTSLPLDYILKNDIMIAYKINNVTLPPENGFPFQLVAEDRLGYKWIRWLDAIELSNDTEYRGYWESRGYGNSADIG